MKLRKYSIGFLVGIFTILSILVLGSIYGESWDHLGETTIYRVVDGNTLELDVDGKRIRMDLALVDTPPPDSYHGQLAIDFLNREIKKYRLLGQYYRLRKIGNEYIGEISLGIESATSLNEELVKQGLARVVVPQNQGWKDLTIQRYLNAQKEAQQNKRGIWAYKGYVTKNGFDAEIGKQILQKHEAAKRREMQEAEARKRRQMEAEKAYRRQIENVLDEVKKSYGEIAYIQYEEDPEERGEDDYNLIINVYVKEKAWADKTHSQKLSFVVTAEKKIEEAVKNLKYVKNEKLTIVNFYSDTAHDRLADKSLLRQSKWKIIR